MSQVTIGRPFGDLDLCDRLPVLVQNRDNDNWGLDLIDGEISSILTRTERAFGQVEKHDSNGGSFSLHPYRNFRR